ncbi:hypothetical protein DRM94_05655 [Aeromonas taiwanensis]|uniref:Beta-ketoacyl synthase N-terminal domain-containing protein n=1 Tax=Aeromonas taiwanensis TaxID=633417 RepID=A0A5F0KD13_9GAMM|nr:hypothetical protein DRM93_05655 [Aeromonas taiwanensis]TFF79037.1 hypothetical protein DRM95_06885 [Aeromonas taiwanensis]TFF82451.1 hypothetical protein DRM94_05655 [Aeromonas taiwanensis]
MLSSASIYIGCTTHALSPEPTLDAGLLAAGMMGSLQSPPDVWRAFLFSTRGGRCQAMVKEGDEEGYGAKKHKGLASQ